MYIHILLALSLARSLSYSLFLVDVLRCAIESSGWQVKTAFWVGVDFQSWHSLSDLKFTFWCM